MAAEPNTATWRDTFLTTLPDHALLAEAKRRGLLREEHSTRPVSIWDNERRDFFEPPIRRYVTDWQEEPG